MRFTPSFSFWKILYLAEVWALWAITGKWTQCSLKCDDGVFSNFLNYFNNFNNILTPFVSFLRKFLENRTIFFHFEHFSRNQKFLFHFTLSLMHFLINFTFFSSTFVSIYMIFVWILNDFYDVLSYFCVFLRNFSMV